MHWIQTQYQLLDFCDYLDFRVREDGLIRLRPAEVDTRSNLVVCAAALLQQVGNCALGADIVLQKRIPISGGLGGGSSDAATTLTALNRLWGLNLGREQLGRIATGLGSDVPLFVHGRSARAEGIGEVLSADTNVAQDFLVIDPAVAVSTAEIYGHPELTRNTPRGKISRLAYPQGHNDCEAVTCRIYPEVNKALGWLRERAAGRMTGTGGCVYAAFDTATQATQARSEVPAPWRAFTAQGRATSPLLERLQEVC